jgi:hypothetical protein
MHPHAHAVDRAMVWCTFLGAQDPATAVIAIQVRLPGNRCGGQADTEMNFNSGGAGGGTPGKAGQGTRAPDQHDESIVM